MLSRGIMRNIGKFTEGYVGYVLDASAREAEIKREDDKRKLDTNEKIRQKNSELGEIARLQGLEDDAKAEKAYEFALAEIGDASFVNELQRRGHLTNLQSYGEWKGLWQNATNNPQFWTMDGFIQDWKTSGNATSIVDKDIVQNNLEKSNNISSNVAKTQVDGSNMFVTKDIPAGVKQEIPGDGSNENANMSWVNKYLPSKTATMPSTKAAYNTNTEEFVFATEADIASNPNLVPKDQAPTKEKITTKNLTLGYFTDDAQPGLYFKIEKGKRVQVPAGEYEKAVRENEALGSIQNYSYFNPNNEKQIAQLKAMPNINNVDELIDTARKNNQTIVFQMLDGKVIGNAEFLDNEIAGTRINEAYETATKNAERLIADSFAEVTFDVTSGRNILNFQQASVNEAKYRYLQDIYPMYLNNIKENGFIPNARNVVDNAKAQMGFVESYAYNNPLYKMEGANSKDIAQGIAKSVQDANDLELIQALMANKNWAKGANKLPGNESIDFEEIAKELLTLMRTSISEENPFFNTED